MATFSKTQSIGVFASINSINKIDLVINPHTGKTFGVSDTGTTFRVGADSPADGEESWMIHKTGQSNVQSTLVF
jgi:hypothetical protein